MKINNTVKKILVIIALVIIIAGVGLTIINLKIGNLISPADLSGDDFSVVFHNSNSVMWVGPHADDELFVAGTLGYLCKDKGYQCSIVAFGKNPKFIEGNKQSAEFLNADYIRLPDRIGDVTPDCRAGKKTKEDISCMVEGWIKKGVKKELVEIIKERKPDIIFTFEPESFLQVSPSHAASSVVTKQAIEESKVNPHHYYTLQTPHLAKEAFDKKKFRVTDVVDLNEKLWGYKMRVVGFYSSYYPSLEKLLEDQEYQNSRLHKEVFRKADEGSDVVNGGADRTNGTTGKGVKKTITVDGEKRTYYLYVPSEISTSKAVPLVFLFHGRGKENDGESFAKWTKSPELADKERFIVVAPDALSYDGLKVYWHHCCSYIDGYSRDDFKFVDVILEEIQNIYSIDSNRIYAAGHSNGGTFSQILGIRRSSVFAAVGSTGAGFGEGFYDELSSAQPFSMIVVCGSRDGFCTLPPGREEMNGVCGRGHKEVKCLTTIEETFQAMFNHSHCNIKPAEEKMLDNNPSDGCQFFRYQWDDCEDGTSLVKIWGEGAGHGWFMENPSDPSYHRCRAFDTTELFWEFFKKHPKED